MLSADLSQLADALRALDKQIAQKQATLQRLRMSIAYQTALIDTLTERVDTRQQAIDLKVGTKINLYDAKEEIAALAVLARFRPGPVDRDRRRDRRIAEREDQDPVAVHRRQRKQGGRSLAQGRRSAPVAGQGAAPACRAPSSTRRSTASSSRLSATTFGQVVATGQQLPTVVPTDGALQVEALVANMDIGFVKVGQPVEVKLDAFPFTRFGALHGKVVAIAAEAVDEQQAKRALANATAPGNSADNSRRPPDSRQSFVFPVTVAIDHAAMRVDGATVPLAPGMTAIVDIKTESRRVIDYLLSPLAKRCRRR